MFWFLAGLLATVPVNPSNVESGSNIGNDNRGTSENSSKQQGNSHTGTEHCPYVLHINWCKTACWIFGTTVLFNKSKTIKGSLCSANNSFIGVFTSLLNLILRCIWFSKQIVNSSESEAISWRMLCLRCFHPERAQSSQKRRREEAPLERRSKSSKKS